MKKTLMLSVVIFVASLMGACTIYAGPFVADVGMDGGRQVMRKCMSKYELLIGTATLIDCEIKAVGKLEKEALENKKDDGRIE